ncbi:5-methyltetrahydropteroyltriglutamate-homocysteine methyltransferase [Pyrenophora seminiperda CCB06]|uniref:5-methyltetrahydropteroyltriglutamate--homocysteine S-methyltransferase n=1 Tax=Pyrenophora seminiperda CCB06 TaxID=1302712 RepID=A0A3M7LV72_9PLEO|nr:5-methyltetrahydropteroyltriglutamate-homocysteine methyltransferase [Pyrenophora seminiperda CCB06]
MLTPGDGVTSFTGVLGFPRMGADRELKKANEAYWADKLSRDDLIKEGKRLRLEHWKIQKDAGVDVIPSNDFAFYDHLLDHIQLFNAIPERYSKHSLHKLDEYFAMGRGHQKDGVDVPSLEMVKWFDSNYHYVKPTFQDGQTFKLAEQPKPVAEFLEAKEAGIITRPVLIGPVSFLALGKADRDQTVDPISLLEKLLPVYVELLQKLKEAGAEYVQIDEPVLVYDLPQKVKDAFKPAYQKLVASGLPKLILATYFGDVVHNFDVFPSLQGVAGIHVDLVRNPEQLEQVISKLGSSQVLSAGVVDGRNIWKTNFKNAIEIVETAVQKLGKDRVIVATSSSLLHTPHSLDSEKKLPEEVKDWFSFAVQKVSEVVVIAKAVNDGPAAVREALEANAKSMQARASSARTNNKAVKDRQASVTPEQHERKSAFPERYAQQKKHLNLPTFPTTTIGDISRPAPMTVKESKYAASVSKKPMKGMLTGPITCLRWSFPRDDVHQSVQAQQLALALRDEVIDLEAAGIFVIQVDEPALREGLPLRAGTEREKYLSWAVDSFKLACAGVQDSTQIHSHFCYSEFQDFFHAIAALDADWKETKAALINMVNAAKFYREKHSS